MRLSDLYENDLKSLEDVNLLKPILASVAQKVYMNWEQDETGYDEDLGEGGICQDIADAMSSVMNDHGIDSMTVDNNGMGDQHVWIIIKIREGVFNVDIPPETYETGGGYTWKKRNNITITPQDVYIDKLSDNPNEFDNYVDY